MHIPDGFLGTSVAVTTWVAARASLAIALRAEHREPAPMAARPVGSVAAFLFAAGLQGTRNRETATE